MKIQLVKFTGETVTENDIEVPENLIESEFDVSAEYAEHIRLEQANYNKAKKENEAEYKKKYPGKNYPEFKPDDEKLYFAKRLQAIKLHAELLSRDTEYKYEAKEFKE